MSKEHAYAYEAGYRDGSIHYELEHCPACKNVADLQEALAENAKLRELVRKLYGDCSGSHYTVSCRGCEHAYEDYGGYVPLDPDYCVFSFSDRYVGCWKQKQLEAEMRELGVEVDE